MPNNIVFNNTAEELKTQLYGKNGSVLAPVSVDGSGNLGISGSVTVANTVTVAAESLSIRALSGTTDSVLVSGSVTVAGTVTVGNTVTVAAESLSIRALSGTTDSVLVSGSVTVAGTVTVGNTVTVVAESLSIRALSGTTDSVLVSGTVNALKTGATFTEYNIAITSGTGTGVTLTFDSSQQTLYSYYVRNNAANTIQVRLQIAPTNVNDYFINDTSTTTDVPPNGGGVVLVTKYFLKHTRLQYDTGTYTANFEAYINAHV